MAVEALKILTGEELMAQGEQKDRELAQQMLAGTAHWGKWHYVFRLGHPGYLRFKAQLRDGGGYEIDLLDCSTGGEILDWLVHMSDKNWISDTDIANLLRAFTTLFPLYSWAHQPNIVQPVRKLINEFLAQA